MSSFLHDFIHLSCVGQAEYTVRDSLCAVFMHLFEPGIYWNTMKSELDLRFSFAWFVLYSHQSPFLKTLLFLTLSPSQGSSCWAAISLLLRCPGGGGDRAEHLLPSPLIVSGELSSQLSLCCAFCDMVRHCSGDARVVGLAGGQGEGTTEKVIARVVEVLLQVFCWSSVYLSM